MTLRNFMPLVWFNNTVTAVDAAATSGSGVSLADYQTLTAAGLLTGEGFFETVAVYRGKPFALAQHLRRLNFSLQRFAMRPVAAELVDRAVAALLQAVPQPVPAVLRLRLTVWRSGTNSELLSALLLPGTGPELGQVNPTFATVVTAAGRRNEHSILTGHKSTSYAENSYTLRAAQTAGASEAVFYNTAGELAEGTCSNLLLERNGELVTPALSTGCLPGITRGLVLRWAATAGLPIREAAPGELTLSVLSSGDFSAALLGTLRNVQHITSWDQRPLPRGTLLTAVAELFAAQMHTAL